MSKETKNQSTDLILSNNSLYKVLTRISIIVSYNNRSKYTELEAKLYKINSNKINEHHEAMFNSIRNFIKNYKIDTVSNICIIDHIHVAKEDRGNKLGSEMLDRLLERVDSDNTIILIKAIPFLMDFDHELTDDEYYKAIVNQCMWLERYGFRSINSILHYDSGIPYIYVNEAIIKQNHEGMSLLKAIMHHGEINKEKLNFTEEELF